MTTTKCLPDNNCRPWRSRIAAAAGLALLTVVTASGQFKRIPGTAQSNMVPCPVAGYTCYPQSIAAGPNGTAWILGTAQTSEGDYYVYRRDRSKWVKTDGAGLQISVGIDGYPWVITHLGTIYYWNGSTFALAPGNGCATSIGVGPASQSGYPYGTPWIIGCDGSSYTAGTVFQLRSSGPPYYGWLQYSRAFANRIAVSPQGVPWEIGPTGVIWYSYNIVTAPAGCATSIAVGSSSDPEAGPYGDGWITGCGNVNNNGAKIFQLQNGTAWVQIPGVASQISITPDTGVVWVVTQTGEIFEN